MHELGTMKWGVTIFVQFFSLCYIKVSILNGLLFIVLCDELIAGSGQQHDSRE
jgi:hypothetical protein